MKDFQNFYGTKAWKQTRDAYIKSVGGWCEDCKAKGILKEAEIVHHKVWLTADNINDASLSLSFSNLKAVCRDCHAEEHEARQRRYKIAEDGSVIINT